MREEIFDLVSISDDTYLKELVFPIYHYTHTASLAAPWRSRCTGRRGRVHTQTCKNAEQTRRVARTHMLTRIPIRFLAFRYCTCPATLCPLSPNDLSCYPNITPDNVAYSHLLLPSQPHHHITNTQ